MIRVFLLTLLISRFWFADAQVNPENIIWQKLPLSTQQDINALKNLTGLGLVAVGDSGLYARFNAEHNHWQIQSVGHSVRLIGAEDIRWQNQGWKNRLVSQDRRFYQILPTGNWQADSLPFIPREYHDALGLINLNIVGNGDLRYGIPSDSGYLYCYKFPWPDPDFEFKLQTQQPINDLYPFNTWNLLAISDSGKIWKAAGLDDQFLPVLQNLTYRKLNAIAGNGAQKMCVVGDSGTCLFSFNGGNSWILRNVSQPKALFAALYGASGRWCVAGEDGFLAITSNDGLNWQDFQLDANMQINALLEFDSLIYVAGSNGKIFREQRINSIKENKDLRAVVQKEGLQLHILSQTQKRLSVELFTLQGQRLETLPEAGHHRINVPRPGLYLLKMVDEAGHTEIRKCLLLHQ